MEVGQEFGSYKLISCIGAGGMGEVWKAEDPRLRRTVAIKILPIESASNSESNARFMREARTAAQLYHPNIATIHSIEEHDGRLFIVMEYVEGESLAHAIRSGRLNEAEVAFIGKGVADALGEAHAHGIVHRDIKPDNVVLSGRKVKVLDFGIAKKYQTEQEASDEGATFTDFRTQRGVILGTIHYMSPEQAMGKALDGRSDIFSLGVVLFEAATGRLPFKGETATDTLTRIIRDEPPDLRATHPRLTPALSAAIMKCLAKEQEARYANASELSQALDTVIAAATTGRQRATGSDYPTAVSARHDDLPTEASMRPKAPRATVEDSRGRGGPWPWIFATTLVVALSVAGTAWYVSNVSSRPEVESPAPVTEQSPVTDAGNLITTESVELGAPPDSGLVVGLDVRPDERELQLEADAAGPMTPRRRFEGRLDGPLPPEPADEASDREKAEALVMRGLWLVGHGSEQEGIELLRRAVELDPSMAKAYVPIGVAALRRGRVDDAKKAFATALRKASDLRPRELEVATFGNAIAVGDLERMNELCSRVPAEGEFAELRRLAHEAGADCAAPPPLRRRGGPSRATPPPRPNP